jgi:hypothetical protein
LQAETATPCPIIRNPTKTYAPGLPRPQGFDLDIRRCEALLGLNGIGKIMLISN